MSGVEDLINKIISSSKGNKDSEKKVYQVFESLHRRLQDILFDTELSPIEPISELQIEKRIVQRPSVTEDQKSDSKNFQDTLNDIFKKNLSHPNLINIAGIIGPKHGLFLSRNEKRSKVLILLWFKNNFSCLKDDIVNLSKSNYTI